MEIQQLKQKLDDLRFAFQSDRNTIACYRDIQGNRTFFAAAKEVEKNRAE